MEPIALITLIVLLTFLSGYCSASETAFFSLSSTKIKTYETSPDSRKKLIANLLSHPRDLLVTIFMMNTLVNILLQNVSSSLFGAAAGWDLKVGVPLVITLLLGEIIPKYIGIQNNTRIANLVAPSIQFFQKILEPIRHFIISITLPISRGLFSFLRKEQSISMEELQHVLKKSEEHGVLNEEEAELVWGYLNLQKSDVREVMRPREDILFYEISEPFSKLTYLMVDQQCTRIPVCKENLDGVLGIFTAKDFLIHRDKIQNPKDLLLFLHKPFYIPENTPAHTLLRRFDEKGEELAIVLDEYGAVVGLIAYEDIVEVVVGNITDRRDQAQFYTKAGENEIIASGKLELSEFNDLFNVNLKSLNNMVTIGGWLTEHLGEIPKSGTKHEAEGFLFQILAAAPNRIRRMYIRKLGGGKK